MGRPDLEVTTEPGTNMDVFRLGPADLADLPFLNGDVVTALIQLLGPATLGSDRANNRKGRGGTNSR